MLRICSLLVLVVLAFLPGAPEVWSSEPRSQAGTIFAGTATVRDGDDLVIGGVRLRLHGIDAPELGQSCTDAKGAAWPCGVWARDQLRGLVQGQRVDCVQRDFDSRHNRAVVRCTVAGEVLNARLVRDGAATAYRRYSTDYVAQENAARAARRGIWRGSFEQPQTHRRGTAAVEVSGRPEAGCDIKGNISGKGERIYHRPGQRFHAQTRIDPARGERWFCSEAEARAAGWRESRR